jgi:hypothetical protein
MGSYLGGWFGYGLGRSIGAALFGEKPNKSDLQPDAPIREQTEEEILADEKRYDEEAKRLDEEDRKRLHR